ncbi:hypothetical protein ACHHYP_20656 [Achlya hypogyna]|uniref:Uncharacterized protein n=1 Tax=Achlya hypogyna TaxID=1202772 RepID=A0A1V9ZFR9_ACHHY|nr:hypothetical protein ACHHYP_20656 [Achlya hypogyna]
MVTYCARCSHRISVFAKKRKCTSCQRRICKECHAKDSHRVPTLARAATSPQLSASSYLRPPSPFRDSTESRGSEPNELTRIGSLSNVNALPCSFGCRDDSLDAPADVPPPLLEADPTDAPEEAAPAPSETDEEAVVVDDDELVQESRLPRVHLTLATDTVHGFVVSVWLCMLWAIVSGSLVHRSYIPGVGASALLLLSIAHCRSSALAFHPHSKKAL